QAHTMNVGLRKAATSHPDHVETDKISQRSVSHSKGNYVRPHAAQADDHRSFTDSNELPNGHATSKHDVITNRHVTGQGRVVCKDNMTSHLAIVPHVGSDHEETPAAHFGDTAAVFSACIHRHVFANIALGANHKSRRPAPITERLRGRPKRCEGVDHRPRTNSRMTREIDVCNQSAALADPYVRTDRAIRADQDVFSDVRPRRDPGRGIDHMGAHVSESMAPTCASATI